MKRKAGIVFLVVLLLLFAIAFSAVWVWNHHKAKLILTAMQTIVPEKTEQLSAYLPSADTLAQAFALSEDMTKLPEDKTIHIPKAVQDMIDASKTGSTPAEAEKRIKKFKKQVNEWVELFSYLLPGNISPEDIEEADVEAVVAIVRAKMSTGEVMQIAKMAEGGVSDAEKQTLYALLSEKFTEEELAVLVQIYRKYTE